MPEYSPGVTLITCTGGRPDAFRICLGLIARQRGYEGAVQWIVVDDGGSGFDLTRLSDLITPVYPKPVWQLGRNTLARNLLAAIPEVRHDKVLFIEDDDWYSADYVATMAAELEHGVTIAGNRDAHYYHLPSRRYRLMENQNSASLCETAIRAELLPILADVCCQGGDFIDVRLWRAAGSRTLRVGLPTGRVVGMKGLPGRPGIGIGHRPDARPADWIADPDLKTLREWIGEDVKLYQEFL
jgi:Glycosyl transferase family 2